MATAFWVMATDMTTGKQASSPCQLLLLLSLAQLLPYSFTNLVTWEFYLYNYGVIPFTQYSQIVKSDSEKNNKYVVFHCDLLRILTKFFQFYLTKRIPHRLNTKNHNHVYNVGKVGAGRISSVSEIRSYLLNLIKRRFDILKDRQLSLLAVYLWLTFLWDFIIVL